MIDYSSSMAQQPIRGQELPIIEASRSHSDTPHSAGNLWTSEQPDADTSTWQHTTLTRDRYQCSRRDSNPQSQQASGRIHDKVTTSLWKSNYTYIIPFMNNDRSCNTVNNKTFPVSCNALRRSLYSCYCQSSCSEYTKPESVEYIFHSRGHADIYFNLKRTQKKIEFSLTNCWEGKE